MILKKIQSIRSLRKSRRVLLQIHRYFGRKGNLLAPESKEQLEKQLELLHQAIFKKQAQKAELAANELQQLALKFIPKTPWDKARDFTSSILFALLVAIVIRQMWFEFYTIPTGSMRPTLKEGDYLVVSKSDYSLNVPLQTSHFYFKPSLVQRGSIVVFTGENMDIQDADTTYFYLFPGKKQLVKRLIGKPGDSLYFYGGKIYGVSARGKDLKELRTNDWFEGSEHIPYIRFDGKVETPKQLPGGIHSPVIFYQMNEPIAKLGLDTIGTIRGEMLPGKNHPAPTHYSDLWGIKNYAMTRLLNKSQLDQIHPGSSKDLEPGVLYLEITHHPTLKGAQLIRDEYGRLRPDLTLSVSLIPLTQEHIERIGNHMTTCRFAVKNGKAHRFGWDPASFLAHLPSMPNIPDGTYEIQNGKASKILWSDIAKALPPDHPLYSKSPESIQLLYNLGVEFLTQYNPSPKVQRLYPSRYAYFRDSQLYLLGFPILQKDDPALIRFLKREYQKQSMSTSVHPYFPFDDNGAPIQKNGEIDIDFIRRNGITIPENMYLVLGDNHAMSGDSRQFGFVPESNLKGAVKFLFWPAGSRFGMPMQPLQPFFAFPNIAVWGAFLMIVPAVIIYRRRKLKNLLK
ncbi:MAG: hypothetical protein A3E80_02740 [Chlamydiae bacterium RIFCSPHIGHO2_12_FULL_49_9]|nr:MAG: hypothetical protein A3E80_02740 [Chlamydiae bacterium RIFCSPHIGHO2_12_FULL_49_9]